MLFWSVAPFCRCYCGGNDILFLRSRILIIHILSFAVITFVLKDTPYLRSLMLFPDFALSEA